MKNKTEIEEDIKILKDFITYCDNRQNFECFTDWNNMQEIKQAIETVLKEYERSKNENKEKIEECRYIEEDLENINFMIRDLKASSYNSSFLESLNYVLKDRKELENKYIHEKVAKEEVEELLENSISKDKIKEKKKIRELTNKLNQPNNDRWEDDDTIYYDKIKAQIRVLQELLESEE